MKQSKSISSKNLFAAAIILLPVWVLIYLFVNRTSPPVQTKAVRGLLDLSAWNPDDGNVPLNGEWEFYWNQLLEPSDFAGSTPPSPTGFINVPGIWNGKKIGGLTIPRNGFATFRLHVLLPPDNRQYALRILTMSNAYRLWVNGREAASNGMPGTDKTTTRPAYHPQVAVLPPASHKLEMVIQIANFYHWKGGFWHPVKLGDLPHIQREHILRLLLQIFLAGCLFIMAFHHIGLFVLRRTDRTTLYFGLVCIIIALRSLLTGENLLQEIVPQLNWFAARKMEFLLTFLSIPVYMRFIHALYREECSRIITRIILYTGYTCATLVLVTPVQWYTFSSYIFTPYSFLFSIYAVVIIFRAALHRREGALLFLITTLFLVLAVINDMLNQTEVIHTGLYLPFGLLMVIFAQAFIIASRSAQAFRTSEIYASTFQKFVPVQFLARVAKDGIQSIKPGNAEKSEISVLFSDIRSFTTLAESMTPDEVFSMLNEYLGYVEPPIRTHHGFVDKYMGDGIMALFEPAGDQHSAMHAVQAALEMQQALARYNRQRQSAGKIPLQMGIGLHTGPVIIGTLGGNERMDSTAIGDAVNLASRIEGMTKMYGAPILISEDTLRNISEPEQFLIRFADTVMAKGKTEPIAIWEVIGRKDDPGLQGWQEFLLAYNQGIVAYRSRHYAEALKIFSAAEPVFPDDALLKLYRQRSRDNVEKGNAPGESITRLTEK